MQSIHWHFPFVFYNDNKSVQDSVHDQCVIYLVSDYLTKLFLKFESCHLISLPSKFVCCVLC